MENQAFTQYRLKGYFVATLSYFSWHVERAVICFFIVSIGTDITLGVFYLPIVHMVLCGGNNHVARVNR